MSIRAHDLYWIAGFLEGEGCFYNRRQMRVIASQVNLEPLERLQALVGGVVKPKKHQTIYEWVAWGPRAAGIAMTLYPLLSRRRQLQAAKTLRFWKSRHVWPRYRIACISGHAFSEANTYRDPKTEKRGCRFCRNQASIRFRARKGVAA